MVLSFQCLLSATKGSTFVGCNNTLGYHKRSSVLCRHCSRFLEQKKTSRCLVKLPMTMELTKTQGNVSCAITESQNTKFICIEYKPPVDYFRAGQDLFYTGGYNNWNGVDSPVILPLRQKDKDSYQIYVPLPEGSQSVEFAFTDGVVYDTNNGAFYHIPLQNLVTENSHKEERFSQSTEMSELDPLKIPEGPTRYTTNEEIALRKARAEATAVGESMGLSNVLMTEARIEFERFDTQMSGWIRRQEAKKCIERLGFEISDQDFEELVSASKQYSRNEDMENIHIIEFIYVYGSLELRNEGLQIL